MHQSGRERLLVFLVSVSLCSIMSSSLSLLAKKNDRLWNDVEHHGKAAEAYPDLQTRSKMSLSLNGSNNQRSKKESPDFLVSSEKIGMYDDGLDEVSQRMEAKRFKKSNGDDMIPGAILAISAAMACVLSAVGALIMIRGPQSESRKRMLEEIGEYHRTLSDDELAIGLDERTSSSTTSLIKDEDGDIIPEESV